MELNLWELFIKGEISFRELLQLSNSCRHEQGLTDVETHFVCPLCWKVGKKQ
jgi:hypothetical protein